MKRLLLAAASLLVAVQARSECIIVEPHTVKTSSQEIRFEIPLHADGTPFKDAKIEIISDSIEGSPLFSMKVNNVGEAVSPKLPLGFFHVVASAPGDFSAEIDLLVTPTAEKQTKPYLLSLTFQRPPSAFDLFFIRSVDPAMSKPPAETVQEFKGVVVDPTGAFTPRVKIRIFPKGFSDASQVIVATTDDKGQFSIPLSSGTYTAVFQMAGFRNHVIVFEIARDGSPKNLEVALELWSC